MSSLTLDDPRVTALAQRMAQRIQSAPDILADLDLTVADYRAVAATPYFRKLLDEAQRAWSSPANIGERIARKAEVVLEEMLPHMAGIAADGKAPPAARVGAYKEVRSLTRVGQPEAPGAGRDKERFVLNIILEPGAGGAALAGVQAVAAVMTGGHSGVTIEGEVGDREPEPWEDAADPPPETVPAPPPRRLIREETFEGSVTRALRDLEDWG